MGVDLAWIRKEFQLTAAMTDHEIERAATFLKTRSDKDLGIMTGNYVEWSELSRMYRIDVADGTRVPVYSLESFSGLYFAQTVWLFVDAYYGPALAWARATLERLLQEESVRFPELKSQIEVEGRNPSIKKMSEALAVEDRWTSEESGAVVTIETNGDWTVHHRIDQFAKGKSFGDYRLGVMRVKTGLGGLQVLGQDLPATVERNLGTEYRKRCVESLQALCTIFQRYRPRPAPSGSS